MAAAVQGSQSLPPTVQPPTSEGRARTKKVVKRAFATLMVGAGIASMRRLHPGIGLLIAVPGSSYLFWSSVPKERLKESFAGRCHKLVDDQVDVAANNVTGFVTTEVPPDLPDLHRAAKAVAGNAIQQGAAKAHQAVDKRLHTGRLRPPPPPLLAGVPLDRQLAEDVTIFALRKGMESSLPHVDQAALALTDQFFAGESAAVQTFFQGKTTEAIQLLSAKVQEKAERFIRRFSVGPSLVERVLTTTAIGSKVGFPTAFVYTSEEVSGAEVVARSFSAVFLGTDFFGNATREVALELIPQEVHDSRVSRAIANKIPAISLYVRFASRCVDGATGCSDGKKQILFQSVTTAAATMLSQGGVMAPHGAGVFTEACGRIGGHLGLVDPGHFSGEGHFVEKAAIRFGIGVATTGVAETARTAIGDVGAGFVYFSGNLIASPMVVDRLMKTGPYQRVRGALHRGAVGVVRWVAEAPKPQWRTWLGRISEALGSEDAEAAWV